MNYSRGGQHPQYGKINNPKLDRGDFIFVPLPTRGKEVTEQTDRKETAEKIALEQELKRLRAEMEKTARTVRELQAKQAQEGRLAYAPKTTKSPYDILRNAQGPFVIDDFEDKDLWSTNLNDKWVRRKRGPARLNLSPDRTQGANGTSSSMKIEYELEMRSACRVQMGRSWNDRIYKIEKGELAAYDLSRFSKISFFVKGEKKKTFFSKPNKILVTFSCYGKDLKSTYGEWALYYNKTQIVPDIEWKRVEIPFDDLIPSAWTKHNVSGYPSNPDLRNVLGIFFMFSSFKGDGGTPGSNTVWIDEITLE